MRRSGLIIVMSLGLGLVSQPALAGKKRDKPPEDPLMAELKIPPKGQGLYGTGMVFTIIGSLHIALGTAMFATYTVPEWPGVLGFIPLIIGGGGVTFGGMLMSFGERRRWAHAEWYLDRGPPGPDAPPGGAGLLLGGSLILAGGGAGLSIGLSYLSVLGNQCGIEDDFCAEFRPETALPAFAIGAGAIALGSGLVVLGGLRRRDVLRWRSDHGRPISTISRLRPLGWADRTQFGLGLAGRF